MSIGVVSLRALRPLFLSWRSVSEERVSQSRSGRKDGILALKKQDKMNW
jgi:hypothetical protein